MKDYRRILVGTDFSEASMTAVRRGSDLAVRYGARLILLHVVEHFPEDMPNDPIAPESRDPLTFYRERAREKLAEVAEALDHRSPLQEVIMSTGSARHEIRCLAEREEVDLIVLGSHGGGLVHAFGSTTMGVTYEIPCDVMVVKGTA